VKPIGVPSVPPCRQRKAGQKTPSGFQAGQINHDPVPVRLYINGFPVNSNLQVRKYFKRQGHLRNALNDKNLTKASPSSTEEPPMEGPGPLRILHWAASVHSDNRSYEPFSFVRIRSVPFIFQWAYSGSSPTLLGT